MEKRFAFFYFMKKEPEIKFLLNKEDMMRKIVFKNGFFVLCFLVLTFAASLILSYEALAQQGLTKIADSENSW